MPFSLSFLDGSGDDNGSGISKSKSEEKLSETVSTSSFVYNETIDVPSKEASVTPDIMEEQ